MLVLDSGARGATTSFVENGQGDVLLAWENEAYLSIKDNPDEYEIVTRASAFLHSRLLLLLMKWLTKEALERLQQSI